MSNLDIFMTYSSANYKKRIKNSLEVEIAFIF